MLTFIDIKLIFDSACLSTSLGDHKGSSVLQILSKEQMSSVELSSRCSCYDFTQHEKRDLRKIKVT